MDAIELFREEMQWAHEYLDLVTADVTPEQMRWCPPGIASPLGAILAHAYIVEDAIVNGMIKKGAPLFASTWGGKTGISDPQVHMSLEGSRELQVDLPALRKYGQAVLISVDDYLASMTDNDLNRPIDLSGSGLGQKPVSWVLNAMVVSHTNNMIGEISCLKGLQGAKGYPF